MINNKKIAITLAISTTVSIASIAYANSILKKDVTLITEGNKVEMSTYTNDVQEFLAEQNVAYDSDDIITVELDKKLVDGDIIEVVDVTQETVTEAKEVEFTTNIVEDDTILKGETVTDTEGKSGENELVYELTYHNGELVDKVLVKENVKTEPVNKVVKKGTKVEEVQVASSRGESTREESKTEISTTVTKPSTTDKKPVTNNSTSSSTNTDKKPASNNNNSSSANTDKKPASNNNSSSSTNTTTKPKPESNNNNSSSNNNNVASSSTMSVVSTAYSINGTTSTGTQTRWGVIAVDPKVIPYGTKVYIPEFGMTFIAEDTGGAIKGNKIDIYMPDRADAIAWGRKTITIQIMK